MPCLRAVSAVFHALCSRASFLERVYFHRTVRHLRSRTDNWSFYHYIDSLVPLWPWRGIEWSHTATTFRLVARTVSSNNPGEIITAKIWDMYDKYFFIAPPLKIRFSVPVDRGEATIFNPRVESRCFNPLHSYSQSDSQKSCYEKYHSGSKLHTHCNRCVSLFLMYYTIMCLWRINLFLRYS